MGTRNISSSKYILMDDLFKMRLSAGDHKFQRANRNFKGGKKQQALPNANVRSEIKNLEQVRKERQKKADKISYMKSKSAKSKKLGKNGKKRKGKK